MAELDAEGLAKPESDQKPGHAGNERQEIVPAARRAGHSFKELPSVEDSDAVEEHDQAGQADRPGDRGLRRKRPDGEADEQDGADTEREAAKVDLADQIADADREEDRKDRLRPDDVTGKIEHDYPPALTSRPRTRRRPSQRALQPAARNWSSTRLISSGVGLGVSTCT